jgi:hypothetical protein
MYFLYMVTRYSTDLGLERGGKSRGFRLEYEVFRFAVCFIGELEHKIFVEISWGCQQPFHFRFFKE